MSYVITNVSGGQLVCSLKDPKKTLRLDNKEASNPIDDKEITPYLENLVKKGYIKMKKLEGNTAPKATNKVAEKSVNKEKEE